MQINFKPLLISIIAFVVAIATLIGFTRNPVLVGEMAPVVRGLILDLAILGVLVAIYPLNPLFRGRPIAYAMAVCVPAMVPALLYFALLLPQRASDTIAATQIRSDLITDGSSNGIVEVGFSYPIYTPTVNIRSDALYTRQVNIFLRMTDAKGGETLFRGVRERVPGLDLSVEASVQSMLSHRDEYLFNPLQLPPGQSITGRPIFIISHLQDGTGFIDALGDSYQSRHQSRYQARFELRDSLDGSLIQIFPLDRI